MAATTWSPITSARTSRPRDSLTSSCSRISWPSVQSVSSRPVTSAMVLAIITPTPWAPRTSLMMQGSPPTSSTAAGTSSR